MATITLLRFHEADGAYKAFSKVQELHRQRLLNLHDAAIVSWPSEAKSPTTRQLTELVKADALGGRFCGELVGQIFAPLFGPGFGALGGSFQDFGIDEDFIQRIRNKVTEGTSALMLMTSEAVVERVIEALKHLEFDIIATSLSKDQLRRFREALGRD